MYKKPITIDVFRPWSTWLEPYHFPLKKKYFKSY